EHAADRTSALLGEAAQAPSSAGVGCRYESTLVSPADPGPQSVKGSLRWARGEAVAGAVFVDTTPDAVHNRGHRDERSEPGACDPMRPTPSGAVQSLEGFPPLDE